MALNIPVTMDKEEKWLAVKRGITFEYFRQQLVSKRIEHRLAMAAPATMDEEEKMLGGSEARESEAKKVEILIGFDAGQSLGENSKISKYSERSRRAKRQHSCGCCRSFYGASCLRCCWTQGANLDFHFVIFSYFPIFWCFFTQVFLTHSPPNITFVPLPQKINSPITYTGHGYIPCDGFVQMSG